LENVNPSQGYAMINSLTSASRRANRIIRLPFSQEEYNRVLNNPKEFRDAIDQMAVQQFPATFYNVQYRQVRVRAFVNFSGDF